MKIQKYLSSLGLYLGLSLFTTVSAETVSIPHNFSAGSPAVAAEVNANFTAVESAINTTDGQITSIKNTVGGNSVRLNELEQKDKTRTISIPSGAFSYEFKTEDIGKTTSTWGGLSWANSVSKDRGGFVIARPADWDQESNVYVKILFTTSNGLNGTVDWRLHYNSYTPNVGEVISTGYIKNATQTRIILLSAQSYRIYDQSFTMLASDFNDEPYWSIFFSRGADETYTSDLYVLGAEITYQAK